MIENYINRKLQTIRRYPQDIYDIKCIVIDVSQSAVVPRFLQRRGIPYSSLALEIIKIVNKNHVTNIEIYQGSEYISDLCLIMYVG